MLSETDSIGSFWHIIVFGRSHLQWYFVREEEKIISMQVWSGHILTFLTGDKQVLCVLPHSCQSGLGRTCCISLYTVEEAFFFLPVAYWQTQLVGQPDIKSSAIFYTHCRQHNNYCCSTESHRPQLLLPSTVAFLTQVQRANLMVIVNFLYI